MNSDLHINIILGEEWKNYAKQKKEWTLMKVIVGTW
jgi:hypothetical protein